MNRLSKFIVEHSRQAWALAILVTIATALLAGGTVRSAREKERQSLLGIEAERRSIEIMSQTLNGNVMGSISLLGLIDPDIKREARGESKPNEAKNFGLLESVGRSSDANGVFIVGSDGIVSTSWNTGDKPSTGLNVKFRPYFQMAMQGKENVYAAVSLARGDRALYFTAPIFSGTGNTTAPTGALVARSGLKKIDGLLKGKSDIALLLSPQGVVFASSRPEWVSSLAGTPTPERLQAIRDLKQFGTMFEKAEPKLLPIGADDGIRRLDGRRYAVSSAKVQWNDPTGEWKVVLLEDLARTVPVAGQVSAAAVAGLLTLVILLLLVFFLRSHHARFLALSQAQASADRLEAGVKFKAAQAAASLRLQQATDRAELGQLFLQEMHKMQGALQGVVYGADTGSEGKLRLLASYACADSPPAELAAGEGLLGQCALERSTRIVATAPDGFSVIRSGLGETVPAAVMMTPLLLNNNLLGVTEISVLSVPGTHECEQFEEMGRMLAINLEILGRVAHTEKMLSSAAAAERDAARLADLERFSRLAHDREQRIIELKHEVNALVEAAGGKLPYVTTLVETVGDYECEPQPDFRTDLPVSGTRLELGDLINLDELQTLLSNFCDAVGIAAALIDLDGTVLAAARWQRACTDFHRVSQESCARCIESDTELALKLQDGQEYTLYRCKNGMTDCASPITVGGQHLANVFIGQFHLSDPDMDFFREQARQYHYAEDDYLRAIEDAPVIDEQRLPAILGFLTRFAQMIGSMSLARRQADEAQQMLTHQAVLLKQERIAALSLAEDAERARQALETRSKES